MQAQQKFESLFSTSSNTAAAFNEASAIVETLSEHEHVRHCEIDISSLGQPMMALNVQCQTSARHVSLSASPRMYAFFSRSIAQALSGICEPQGWFVVNVFTDLNSRYPDCLKIELSRNPEHKNVFQRVNLRSMPYEY